MTRQTSIDCYKQIKEEGLLSTRRMQIYEILFENGPATGTEVSMIFKSRYPSTNHSEGVRNRITELYERGVAFEVGTRKCQYTGRTVTVWDVNGKLPSEPNKTKEYKFIYRDEAEEILNKRGKYIYVIMPQ